MPIYEITEAAIRKLGVTTFSAAGIKERSDLQRLLRRNIDVVSPDTLVVAAWGSRRVLGKRFRGSSRR
jgi:hypothetical protein